MKKIFKTTWIDSKVQDFYQVDEDSIPEPCVIESVGWLVKATNDYQILAREKVDEQWRGVITIPVSSIKETIQLI